MNMKNHNNSQNETTILNTHCLAAVLSFILLAGTASAGTSNQDQSKANSANPSSKPAQPTQAAPARPSATHGNTSGMMGSSGGKVGSQPDKSGTQGGKTQTTVRTGKDKDNSGASGQASTLRNDKGGALTTKTTPKGYVKVAPSGAVREKMEKTPEGERTQHFTPTGRVEKEVVKKTDGTEQTIHYASNGKVAREEVLNKDGTRKSPLTNSAGMEPLAPRRPFTTIVSTTRSPRPSSLRIPPSATSMAVTVTCTNHGT